MSISSPQGSPASPSASLANGSAPTTSGGSGPPPATLYAQWDPSGCSWRTSQPSFEMDGHSEPSLGTFTASGSMRNGQLFARPTSARPITVNGSTSWPTPRASMGSHGVAWVRAETGEHRSQLEDYLAWRYLQDGGQRIRGLHVNPEWTDWLMGFPSGWTDCEPPETPSSPQ